jgi:Fe-S-cluster containining protein
VKPERNTLCSCGSGKKYKKCCGATPGTRSPRPDYIAVNRAVAYVGAIGEQRRTFCTNYAAFKQSKIEEIQATLAQDIASNNLAISCGQACSHCCSQFVVASLQECEAIVHYLYQNETELQHFINAFPIWLNKIAKIESCYRELNYLCEKINSGKATKPDLHRFNDAGRIYAGLDSPCPFLVEKGCSIYKVRPFVCANYFSVSSPEWCQASHQDHKKAVHVKIKLLGKDMPYFIQLPKNRLVAPVPILVHRILEEGYGAISSITGISDLKDKVLADPAIRAALQKALS